jgi:hypothetical protein
MNTNTNLNEFVKHKAETNIIGTIMKLMKNVILKQMTNVKMINVNW